MPEHTIPFAGSRFRQSIDVRLGEGATLILWDAVASGRIAHGERWRFSSLNNSIRIAMPSSAAIHEQYALAPEEAGGVGRMRQWDYVGSLFVAGSALAGDVRDALETGLADILDRYADRGILGGVSQPAATGVVVKLVARSAPIMTEVVIELWAAVRMALWRMPPANLRKY
jgi:urease accessory protein